MLIIKIDAVNFEPSQTSFARTFHVFGFAVDAAKLRFLWIAQDPKLRCDDHLVAMSFDSAPEQLFVRVRPVDVGRVEERNAELERALNGGERFFIVASAIKVGHAHATESDCGNDWTAAAEFALFHIKLVRPIIAANSPSPQSSP